MLLCFLAFVIATLTSYTVQFMNCPHCLLDKTSEINSLVG